MLIKLVGLALVDSIGVGTLVVPLWMMLRPSFRARLVLLFLGALGLLYFGVGIAASAATGGLTVVVPGDPWVRLAVGLVVLLAGLVCDRRRRRRDLRGVWWARPASSGPGSVRGVVLLAVAVGVMEVATMLPYFAAIDAVAHAGLGRESSSLLLAAYVLAMLSPALVLLTARVIAQERLSSISQLLLQRVDRWSAEASGTVLLVLGALLAASAALEMNLV